MKSLPLGARFFVRWLVNSLGLWIAASMFTSIEYDSRVRVVIIAGFLLAVLNVLLKPFLVILSLPAIVFSRGLFMILINGLLVALVSFLYKPLHINSFWSACLAGVVIGLVNYLVTTILEERADKKEI